MEKHWKTKKQMRDRMDNGGADVVEQRMRLRGRDKY